MRPCRSKATSDTARVWGKNRNTSCGADAADLEAALAADDDDKDDAEAAEIDRDTSNRPKQPVLSPATTSTESD